MKISMICGSPRPSGSTSMYLLGALQEKLADGNEIEIFHILGEKTMEPMVQAVYSSDVLVFAFPLYVDSVPSSMLGAFKRIEQNKPKNMKRTKVYLIVNNGFYDAIQNRIAIDICWNWCRKCDFEQGYAIGVGGGGMTQMAPLEQGPLKNLGNAVGQLAENISKQNSGDTVLVEPNFPRMLYLKAAHMEWKKQAKNNGLKVSDIKRKLSF